MKFINTSTKVKLKPKFKHLKEDVDYLYHQYYDATQDYCERTERILYVVNQLPKIYQDIFYMYAELRSERKVADETNVSRGKIVIMLKEIRDAINNLTDSEFERNYILPTSNLIKYDGIDEDFID